MCGCLALVLAFLENLATQYVGDDYGQPKTGAKVSLPEVPFLAKRSFPLCMQNMHSKLVETHHLKHSTHNPQKLMIIEHMLTEVMILGFVSMSFFFLHVNDVTGWMARVDKEYFKDGYPEKCQNTAYDQFHLMEFFHYAIFVTMCFIAGS